MRPNWGETYAPVGKLTAFRYLASLAARHGLTVDHLNVLTTFLNPHVGGPELCMEVPDGRERRQPRRRRHYGRNSRTAEQGPIRTTRAPWLWYEDIGGLAKFHPITRGP